MNILSSLSGRKCTASVALWVVVGVVAGVVGIAGCGGGSVTAAPAAPVVVLSPNPFPSLSMVAGGVAATGTETVTNSGTAALTIGSVTIGGTNAADFTQTNTCGSSLAVSASCTVTVTFSAATAGTYSATLNIPNSASAGGTASVTLTGTATAPPAPVASLNPTSLSLPSMVAGGTATTAAVTLTNSGAVAMTVGSVTITGTGASEFSIKANTCGTTLAAAASCTVTVSFSAATAATYTAALNIANNGSAGGTVAVPLTGTATPPQPVTSLSASSLTFPSVTAGGAASTQVETLTNTGAAALTVSGITFSGTNASNFTQTNTCSAAVPVNGTCAITVSFSAATVATYTATMNIANNGSTGGTVAVGLSGAAVLSTNPVASLSATSMPFPTLTAGSTSSAQTITLTNTGASNLNIASIAMTGAGANLFIETSTCATVLASKGSCTISTSFAPKVAGTYAATLTVTDNSGGTAGTTQTIPATGTATPFTITVNTSNACAWVIDNGAITFNWNAESGDLNSWILDGTSDELVDTTTTSSSSGCPTQPRGLYSGMVGPFMNGTPTASCTAVGVTVVGTPATNCTAGSGSMPYLDWAITWPDTAASSSNAYTFVWHYLVFPNDPGVHTYIQLIHSASDIAGGVGQIQWIFRDSLSTFTNTYEVNSGLGILGAEDIPLPSLADSSSDPGRAVSNAVEDLHGFSDIPGTGTSAFGRYFETKYDYAGYEYLHQAHGLYGVAASGTTYGVWTVMPKLETLVGGPTKQNLWFTGNIDMIEAYSNHEDNNLTLNATAGVASNRLFGPYYIHVNTMGAAYNQAGTPLKTQADMYADAIAAETALVPNYDNVTPLVAAGYVPTTGRGSVSIQVNGVTGAPHTAWAVLSDPATNMQYSSAGYQYWADISNNGTATIAGVAPGTYRLSVYDLGQWGEYRQDGIVVTAGQTATVPTVTFVPENFAGTTGSTVFTIGTPDRSSHEFLHGHFATTVNPHMVAGNDDREFFGNWNYWADFQANNGAVVYYATAVGGTPATKDPTQWNYVHWNKFDPGLYDPSNDTTDGYSNTANAYGNGIPTYVAGLTGASGTNGVSTGIPAWQVYFATPNPVPTTGYVDLSISLACGYSSDVVSLNGSQRIWHYTNYSDCMIRSGLSGYTQWFVMEWPVSALNQTAGGSNEITSSMSSSGDGVEDDAWRLEISPNGANPATTGWNDYTYITGTNYPGTGTANSSGLYNNDALPNP